MRLGIPMYGADPKFLPFGTKSGSRRLFVEEGIPHPVGRENIHSTAAAIDAIRAIRHEKPGVCQVIVKLNEAFSGEGNALADLQGLPPPGAPDEASRIEERLRVMRCELAGMTYETFCERLEGLGGVVEERIAGEEFRSPSVQLRITPLGEVELLSTHDQLLGGTGGQSYLGCRFPADPEYAPMITREAKKVGTRLAKEGVLGRFAIDFVVVRSDKGAWQPYAIEVNLRKGGTTHPFLTLQFLTDGTTIPTGRYSLPPAARRSTSSPPTTWNHRLIAPCRPTTCSTSPFATASTSTRRARPGSFSTCWPHWPRTGGSGSWRLETRLLRPMRCTGAPSQCWTTNSDSRLRRACCQPSTSHPHAGQERNVMFGGRRAD